MKSIEIDEELYQYIASNTQFIGESASSILRRLLSKSDSSLVQSIDSSVSVEAINNTSTIKHVNEPLVVEETVVEPSDELSKQTSIYNYINKEELAAQRGVVGRFLLVLAALHRVHKNKFSVVCDIRGRDRLYFANSELELDASGSSTKPRQIPGSPYWVITNSNTTRKKMMITEAAKALGYQTSEIESIRDLL